MVYRQELARPILVMHGDTVDERLEQSVLAEQCRRMCTSNAELGRQAETLNNRLSVINYLLIIIRLLYSLIIIRFLRRFYYCSR